MTVMEIRAPEDWSFDTPSTWVWVDDKPNLGGWKVGGQTLRVGVMVHDKPMSRQWRRGRLVVVTERGRVITARDELELPPDLCVLINPHPNREAEPSEGCFVMLSMGEDHLVITLDPAPGGLSVSDRKGQRLVRI